MKSLFNKIAGSSNRMFRDISFLLTVISVIVGMTVTSEAVIAPASYVIYKDGTTYYSQNGQTGVNDYSGTNAVTVIQSTINALTSGGKIFLKAAEYDITAGGASIDINAKSNIMIQGAGIGNTVLKQTGTVSGQLLEIIKIRGNSKQIVISNLTLRGVGDITNMEQGRQGIRITSSDDIIIQNVSFEKIDGAIIRIEPTCNRVLISSILNTDGLSAGGVTFDGAIDSGLYESYVRTWDASITIVRSRRVEVKNNWLLTMSPSAAIDALTQSATDIFEDFTVEGNQIYLNGGVGVRYTADSVINGADVHRFHINRNTISGANYAIFLAPYSPWGMTEIEIKDNIIKDTGPYQGIYIQPGNNNMVGLEIVGNTIIDGQRQGIFITRGGTGQTYKTIIQSNIIARNGKAGTDNQAVMASYLNEAVILNNIIYDNQTTPTQVGGIYVTGGGNRVQIKNNDIGNTTYPVYVSGITYAVINGNQGYVTENNGTASVANGGTIAHGLAGTPTSYSVTATVAKHIAVVTAVNGTNLTIGLHDDMGNPITTAENVSWHAEYRP